jgi:hypothetical protein
VGGYFNVDVDKFDTTNIMMWHGEDNTKKAFPKLVALQEEHKEYIETRCQDMKSLLDDSKKMMGTFAHMEQFPMIEGVYGLFGNVLFLDMPGAQPWGVCSKGDALRQGSTALPCAGLPNLITPLQDDVYVMITTVGEILALGGITLGSSFTKYIEGADGKKYYESKVVKVLLSPGDILYVPFGSWPQLFFFEEPLRGKEKKAQIMSNTSVLMYPLAIPDMFGNSKPEIKQAIKVANYATFEKKAGKRIWEDKRAFFEKCIELPSDTRVGAVV